MLEMKVNEQVAKKWVAPIWFAIKEVDSHIIFADHQEPNSVTERYNYFYPKWNSASMHSKTH